MIAPIRLGIPPSHCRYDPVNGEKSIWFKGFTPEESDWGRGYEKEVELLKVGKAMFLSFRS